ncbi:MAG TPA: DUF4386 domain-containing protein [Terriglobales bacterium]|nr:DUF4386 domain-containing protein [Terriglobales bacterium]
MTETTNRTVEASPQLYARIGGVLYLIIIVAGGFAELFVRDKLIAPRDAAATAGKIMASEPLWRMGFAATLVMLVCAVALTMIFYVLLKPVNRNLALLAVLFNLVDVAIEGINNLHHFAAVLILGGADYLKAFDPHQLQALALLSTKLFAYGYGIGLVFFGCESLLRGYLIFRSGYFPRFLGVLVTISGLSYLTNSFTLFLSPAVARLISSWILLPAGIPELILALWLVVVGVNVAKWKEKIPGLRN